MTKERNCHQSVVAKKRLTHVSLVLIRFWFNKRLSHYLNTTSRGKSGIAYDNPILMEPKSQSFRSSHSGPSLLVIVMILFLMYLFFHKEHDWFPIQNTTVYFLPDLYARI